DSASLLTRLGNLLNIPPLSVEVIPGDGSDWPPRDCMSLEEDHRPFLFIEGNLGLPQKVLCKAYITAVRDFTRLRPTHCQPAASDTERLANLSAVILLANPAHQTALNLRKKLVVCGFLDASTELQLCTAMLVVRENSKQSLLWHHRRWLLHRVHPLANDNTRTSNAGQLGDTLRDVTLPADALRSEFSVAAQACETYPRNYFAWIHRHLCLDALFHLACAPCPTRDSYRALLVEETRFARTWIERHVSDYTAVHYFHGMHVLLLQDPSIFLPEDALGKLGVDGADGGTLCTAMHTHAENLLKAYPEHESLWLYLRAAM
ncbi:protein prenylyltransferase, partial [Fomitopsis betulina]